MHSKQHHRSRRKPPSNEEVADAISKIRVQAIREHILCDHRRFLAAKEDEPVPYILEWDTKSPHEIVHEELGQYRVLRALEPKVRLCGAKLPQSGVPIHLAEPATSLPDDTFPALIEALLREYTSRGKLALFLWGRSRAPIKVASRLRRQGEVVDSFVEPVDPFRGFKLNSVSFVFAQLPQPGIVDRRKLYSPFPTPWFEQNKDEALENLPRDQFFDKLLEKLVHWGAFLSPNGRLAIQSGHGVWNEGGRERSFRLWPEVLSNLTELGFEVERTHPLRLQPQPSAEVKPELLHGMLHVLKKQGGEE